MHVASLMPFARPPDAAPSFLRDLVDEVRRDPSVQSPWNLKLRYPHLVPSPLQSWVVDERLRPRLPRAPLRAGQPGRRARARRARLAPAQQPDRPQPAAVGDASHRGPGGRPLRAVYEDAPRAGGRLQRGPADGAQPVRRPRRARHAAVLQRAAAGAPPARGVVRRRLRRRSRLARPGRAGPGRVGDDAGPADRRAGAAPGPASGPRRSPARAALDPQQADRPQPPLRHPAVRAGPAQADRQGARRDHQRRAAGASSAAACGGSWASWTSCRTRRWWRSCRSTCARKATRAAATRSERSWRRWPPTSRTRWSGCGGSRRPRAAPRRSWRG